MNESETGEDECAEIFEDLTHVSTDDWMGLSRCYGIWMDRRMMIVRITCVY